MICNGALLLIEMLRVLVTLCVGASESVTLTVKLNGPVTLGVPEIRPLLLRVRPVGRLPPVWLHV